RPNLQTPRNGRHASEAMLSSALADKSAQIERRIFHLLAVLYPDAEMERIYAGIRDSSPGEGTRRRANALELLESLFPKSVRRQLMPLVDDVPRAEKLRAVPNSRIVETTDEKGALLPLCKDGSGWVRACALYHAQHINHPLSVDLALEGTRDPDPIVREMS